MRLAIIGSRGITRCELGGFIKKRPSLIVSGGAVGVDTLAYEYARKEGIPFLTIFPEYHRYGRKAPLIRDKAIIDTADFVLAIWDGKSRGTLFSIKYAIKTQKITKIIIVNSNS